METRRSMRIRQQPAKLLKNEVESDTEEVEDVKPKRATRNNGTNVRKGVTKALEANDVADEKEAEVDDHEDPDLDDDFEPEEENKKPRKTKVPPKKKSKASAKTKILKKKVVKVEVKVEEVVEEETEEKEEEFKSGAGKSIMRTVRCRGPAAVMESCPDKDEVMVYASGSDVYSIMLNKTDIGNNNNKFYGIQVLCYPGNSTSFACFLNWGRVGYKGQNSLHKYGSAAAAMKMFCSKFTAKSGLDWVERNEDPIPGKYRVVEVDHFGVAEEHNDPEEVERAKKEEEEIESKLKEEVQAVIRMITDQKLLAKGIKAIELSYDNSEKMPLGKLTDAQLKRGYESLKRIETLLGSGKPKRGELVQATNDFYSNIPHNFGFRVPSIIDSIDEVKLKTELLDTLKEVQIAITTIGRGEDQEFEEEKVNPIDRMYGSLKCGLEVVTSGHDEFKMISSYLKTNHGDTHMYEMKLEQLFAVRKFGEDERFISDCGNKQLLWHGSRLTNMCGILSHGLRIAPPEAPVTGYMFGKGVYFADVASKSGNYCYPRHGETGFMLLAEVALGETHDLKDADYKADILPTGKHSTFGMGQIEPEKSGHLTMWDDVIVPIGRPVRLPERRDCSLLYNEFIVYKEAQVRLRYLVQIKFLTE